MMALVFQTVLILLLACFHTGEAVDQYQLMEALIGITGNVTLPCHVEPATDATDELLEWSRSDLNPRFVHVRRDGEDNLVDQNPSYMGRTSVFVDGLKQGNMSLRLSRVRLSDEGTYRCFSPNLKTDSRVQLVVIAVIEITKVSAGVLECKSAGWYPEPEVLWLDGDGNLLTAEPTETVTGPDDLYTVSSRVTVEKSHGNNFTCRVQQNNKHRDAKFHVADPSAKSAIPAVIGLVLFVLVVLAFALFAWRQNKNNTKENHEDEESQSEGSEKESLMRSEKKETQHNIGGTQESRTLQEQPVERGDAESASASVKTETASQSLMNENVKETLTGSSDTAAQNPTKGEETPEDSSTAETKNKDTKENSEDEESQSEDSDKDTMVKNEDEVEEHKAETQMNQTKVEAENNASVAETSQKTVDSSVNGQQQSDKQPVKSGTTPESETERKQDEEQTDEENTEDQKKTQNQEEQSDNNEGKPQLVDPKSDGEQVKAESNTSESEINSNIQSQSQEGIANPGAAASTVSPNILHDVDRADAENVSTSMTAETADQSLMNESKEETSTDNRDTTAQNPTKGEEDSSEAQAKTKKTKKNSEDEESQSDDSEKEVEEQNVLETSQVMVDSSINGQQQRDGQSVKSGTTPESEYERQQDEEQTDEKNTENQTTKQNQE